MCALIVVDAGRSRSTWHGRDAYIHDHCLRYLHNYAIFNQCSTVICSPTVIHAILREATSETYGPRVSFLLYCISFIYIASHLLFCNLYFPIYTTKIPKIFILLSLSDLTFASGREGIDNPFIALVARFLIVCGGTGSSECCGGIISVSSQWHPFLALAARFLIFCAGTRWLVCCLLLDWYLGSQKLREILTLLCCITLFSSRENQRMLKR